MLFTTIETPGLFQGQLSIVPALIDKASDGRCVDVTATDRITYTFVTLRGVCSRATAQVNELFGAMLSFDPSGTQLEVKWFKTRTHYEAVLKSLQETSPKLDGLEMDYDND